MMTAWSNSGSSCHTHPLAFWKRAHERRQNTRGRSLRRGVKGSCEPPRARNGFALQKRGRNCRNTGGVCPRVHVSTSSWKGRGTTEIWLPKLTNGEGGFLDPSHPHFTFRSTHSPLPLASHQCSSWASSSLTDILKTFQHPITQRDIHFQVSTLLLRNCTMNSVFLANHLQGSTNNSEVLCRPSSRPETSYSLEVRVSPFGRWRNRGPEGQV